MTLIYATSNAAKLQFMKNITDGIGIHLLGLEDLKISLPDVDENGSDPLENAEIKARAYYDIIKQPLFSCDSGLYFEGLPTELQPGVHVRNINGKRLNDDEMTEYYSGLARKFGGRLEACYRNGICLIMSKTQIYRHSGEDISYNKFFLSDKPHPKRISGFPLDCLSIHMGSGKYYYDMAEGFELERKSDDAFRKFFIDALQLY